MAKNTEPRPIVPRYTVRFNQEEFTYIQKLVAQFSEKDPLAHEVYMALGLAKVEHVWE